MKTKKILPFLFCMFLTIHVQAQTTKETTMELLTHATWEHGKPIYGDYRHKVFNDSIMTDWHKDQYGHLVRTEYPMKYYLTDKEEKAFDKTKIGKIKNGKYIMAINPHGGFICYRILELSKEQLKIVSIRLQGTMSTPNIPWDYTPLKE